MKKHTQLTVRHNKREYILKEKCKYDLHSLTRTITHTRERCSHAHTRPFVFAGFELSAIFSTTLGKRPHDYTDNKEALLAQTQEKIHTHITQPKYSDRVLSHTMSSFFVSQTLEIADRFMNLTFSTITISIAPDKLLKKDKITRTSPGIHHKIAKFGRDTLAKILNQFNT